MNAVQVFQRVAIGTYQNSESPESKYLFYRIALDARSSTGRRTPMRLKDPGQPEIERSRYPVVPV